MKIHLRHVSTSRPIETPARRPLLRRAHLVASWLLFALTLWFPGRLLAAETNAAAANFTAIKAGRFLDVVRGEWLEHQVILIQGEVIQSVGAEASVTIPPNASIVDLSEAWILPGLIDCHTHITGQMEDYYADLFRKSPIDVAVAAHVFAKRTLEAGFTTCRDVGAGEFIDVALKRAIARGRVVGPRLFVAGHMISPTGGHGDLSGFSPYLHFNNFDGVADGVDEIRKKIRWQVKNGIDLTKFCATAGVLSEEESAGAPQYSFPEMQAIVEESAHWGRKVAAHAHGAEGIKLAVRAGVNSIEHGTLIDAEGVAMMKERGTFLVPTIYVGYAVEKHGGEWKLPEKLIEKARRINRQKRESLQQAFRSGVKIAYGTDAGVFAHGENAADFRYLVEFGLSPLQAIQTATMNAADLLGQSEKLGTLQAGKYADLIAVTKNPLQDITALEQVPFVMKGGVVHKNQINARPR